MPCCFAATHTEVTHSPVFCDYTFPPHDGSIRQSILFYSVCIIETHSLLMDPNTDTTGQWLYVVANNNYCQHLQ